MTCHSVADWGNREPGVSRGVSAYFCHMAEGAIIDGIGNALFGEMKFNNGVPERSNFDQYLMIRHAEAPKEIDVHFVQNEIDPTGIGEPPFPPEFAALANAIYGATNKRLYQQPFLGEEVKLG